MRAAIIGRRPLSCGFGFPRTNFGKKEKKKKEKDRTCLELDKCSKLHGEAPAVDCFRFTDANPCGKKFIKMLQV